MVLNIAEGAGRTAHNDKRRYYEIAKGSIAECSAILDLLHGRHAIRESEYIHCRNLAIEITLMLHALAGPPRFCRRMRSRVARTTPGRSSRRGL